MRRRVTVVAIGVAVLAASVVFLGGSRLGLGSGGGPPCTADTKTDRANGPGLDHVANPTYKVNPPAGGNHSAEVARAGAYGDGYMPPDGQIVRAMEQGYVVLWYRPDLDLVSVAALQDLAFRHAADVLTVPRPSLGKPIAASAWHARLLCRSTDIDALERFINTRVNQGPEKVIH